MTDSWIKPKLSTERKPGILCETKNWLAVLWNERLYLGRSIVIPETRMPFTLGINS